MTTRRYEMTARAKSAEETRLRIIAAAVALFMEKDWALVTLEAVAQHAGVTLQTVLRRFGSKAALFSAAVEQTAADVERARTPAEPHDVRAALRALVSSYEQLGALNWRLLCHEASDATLHGLLERARGVHRAWLEQVFAHALPARGAERTRRLSLLFSATDFYVWKLERVDFGRTRAQAEQLITELVQALLRDFETREDS